MQLAMKTQESCKLVIEHPKPAQIEIQKPSKEDVQKNKEVIVAEYRQGIDRLSSAAENKRQRQREKLKEKLRQKQQKLKTQPSPGPVCLQDLEPKKQSINPSGESTSSNHCTEPQPPVSSEKLLKAGRKLVEFHAQFIPREYLSDYSSVNTKGMKQNKMKALIMWSMYRSFLISCQALELFDDLSMEMKQTTTKSCFEFFEMTLDESRTSSNVSVINTEQSESSESNYFTSFENFASFIKLSCKKQGTKLTTFLATAAITKLGEMASTSSVSSIRSRCTHFKQVRQFLATEKIKKLIRSNALVWKHIFSSYSINNKTVSLSKLLSFLEDIDFICLLSDPPEASEFQKSLKLQLMSLHEELHFVKVGKTHCLTGPQSYCLELNEFIEGLWHLTVWLLIKEDMKAINPADVFVVLLRQMNKAIEVKELTISNGKSFTI